MSRSRKIETRPLKSLNRQRNERIPLQLSTYTTKIQRLGGSNSKDSYENNAEETTMPACSHTIMELARSRLFQLNSRKDDVFCIIANRYVDKLKKSAEPFEDLELAMLLLASAERVAEKDFACARKLLCLFDNSPLTHGSPVQRIVSYLAEALTEKINISLGAAVSSTTLNRVKPTPIDVTLTQASLEPAMIESHHESCSVVIDYTGIQCILDNISTSSTIHLIDFGIKNGSHLIVLMQALAVRSLAPVKLLKITAVGMSKQMLEETGRWLSSFASTLDLCFAFNVVVADLTDVEKDQFKLEDDETLAVYLPRCLSSLLAWPHKLERLIGMIKELNPSVMVVLEAEATINSPIFLDRFNEALAYFTAVFDCMSVRFEKYGLCRKLIEACLLRHMIQNIITQEGTNRIYRYERISFWRALFERFDLVETVLSTSALSQASIMLKLTSSNRFYTSFMDGECLILGWNEIPFQSVSAWKFIK